MGNPGTSHVTARGASQIWLVKALGNSTLSEAEYYAVHIIMLSQISKSTNVPINQQMPLSLLLWTTPSFIPARGCPDGSRSRGGSSVTPSHALLSRSSLWPVPLAPSAHPGCPHSGDVGCPVATSPTHECVVGAGWMGLGWAWSCSACRVTRHKPPSSPPCFLWPLEGPWEVARTACCWNFSFWSSGEGSISSCHAFRWGLISQRVETKSHMVHGT